MCWRLLGSWRSLQMGWSSVCLQTSSLDWCIATSTAHVPTAQQQILSEDKHTVPLIFFFLYPLTVCVTSHSKITLFFQLHGWLHQQHSLHCTNGGPEHSQWVLTCSDGHCWWFECLLLQVCSVVYLHHLKIFLTLSQVINQALFQGGCEIFFNILILWFCLWANHWHKVKMDDLSCLRSILWLQITH